MLGPLLVFQRTNSRFRCKNIPGLAAPECFFLYSRPSRVLSYSSGWHSRVADYRSGFDSETSRREKLSPSSARRRGNAHSAGCTLVSHSEWTTITRGDDTLKVFRDNALASLSLSLCLWSSLKGRIEGLVKINGNVYRARVTGINGTAHLH